MLLRPHDRQHGPRQCEQAEHVGVELGTDLVLQALLDCGLVAVAGIVHEHVYAAEALGRGMNPVCDLPCLDDVQRQRQGSVTRPLSKFGNPRLVARGDDRTPATVED